MRIRYAVIGIALVFVAWSLPVAFRWALTEPGVLRVGQPAPPFRAVTLDTGDTLTLDDYRGGVVLLNLWATWCAPCRQEMPSMQRLLGVVDDDRFAIVAVDVDARETPRQIRAFAEELKLTFDILHDRSEFTSTRYQVYGLPQSFLIDPQGILRAREFGAVMWDDSTHVREIRQLLAGSATH